jgi:2-iminobutanoate/2-iminopropanoate deaminase
MGKTYGFFNEVLGSRMSELIHIDHADGLTRSYSAATNWGGLVFPCGQVPYQEDGSVPVGIKLQTIQCLENLSAALAHANSSIHNLLQVTVFLSDQKDFDEYDSAWREFFGTSKLPPRTTVFVSGFRGEKRIEISSIATKKEI